mgnify:CR=1 FL=1
MNYRRVFLDNGLVFITVVTQNRCPILIDNIEIVKNSYIKHCEFIVIDLLLM